jgi:hypothetical protein
MRDGTFYTCVPGWPDLSVTFRAKALPPIFPWLVELIEAPAPRRERSPSDPEVIRAELADDGDPAERYKRAIGIARKVAGDLATTRAGGRNDALNIATAKIAGRAAWAGVTESECRDLMWWACGVNKLTRDDGEQAFHATFDSAWRFGIANPLRLPRDRNADTGGVIIDLQ